VKAGLYPVLGLLLAPGAAIAQEGGEHSTTVPAAVPADPSLAQRVEELEGVLAKLRGQFDALCSKLGESPAGD